MLAANAPLGSFGQGSYSWAIPANIEQLNDYKIEIRSNAKPEVMAVSGPIAIKSWVKVLEPNGAEQWYEGGYYTIKWEAHGYCGLTASIILLRNGQIANYLNKAAPQNIGINSCTVHLPYGSYDQYNKQTFKIKIEPSLTPAASDTSDQSFHLEAVPH